MKKSFKAIGIITAIAALICFTYACQDKEAMAELEELKAQEAIEAQNLETVQKWLKARNEGDIELIYEEMIGPNAIHHYPDNPEIIPIEGWLQKASEYDQPQPEVKRSVEPILAQGDKVAFRYLVEVNDQGRKLKVEGITIIRFEGGKIVETWTIEDSLGFAKQLGYELVFKEQEK